MRWRRPDLRQCRRDRGSPRRPLPQSPRRPPERRPSSSLCRSSSAPGSPRRPRCRPSPGCGRVCLDLASEGQASGAGRGCAANIAGAAIGRSRRVKRDSHYAALALFDQALKADPNDADALAGEAFTYMALYTFGEAATETSLDGKIIDQADRAIALSADNMRAYAAKSLYLAGTGRANQSLRAADSGLAIDPNNAPLLDARTLAEISLGHFERAKSDAQQAMRLSPRDPETPNRLINLGMAELGLRRFDAVIDEFQKAIDAGAHYFIPYVNLAAAYALAGKMDEAKSALAEGRRLNPNLTVKWLTNHAPNLPPLDRKSVV